MGGLFSRPKAPPPPSPAVEETVSAQEAAATAEEKRQKSIIASSSNRKKGGLMAMFMPSGTRPDAAEKNLKQKLGGGVRNPRNLL